jgi:lysophospholipase L1-like esterase
MWNIRLAQILQAAQPQLVLVSLGTNDSVGTVFSSEQAALDGIIKTVQDAGAVLVWIGPPTLPASLVGQDAVRAALKAAVPNYFDSTYVNMPVRDAAQGIHPTPAEYAQWADSIWDWLTFNRIVE